MDLGPYINQDGFVTVQENAPTVPGEGNGWLQTGVAYHAGVLTLSPEQREAMLQRSLYRPTPLLARSPHKKNPGDEEKADDYWCAISFSEVWAQALLEYAEANGWDFTPPTLTDRTLASEFEYRFARFPAFAPAVRLAAKNSRPLTFWEEEVVVAGKLLWGSVRMNAADGNMKNFCLASLVQKRSPRLAPLGKFWIAVARARFGNLGGAWADYFGAGHEMSKIP